MSAPHTKASYPARQRLVIESQATADRAFYKCYQHYFMHDANVITLFKTHLGVHFLWTISFTNEWVGIQNRYVGTES